MKGKKMADKAVRNAVQFLLDAARVQNPDLNRKALEHKGLVEAEEGQPANAAPPKPIRVKKTEPKPEPAKAETKNQSAR
jgi:hypothetical protein